MKTQKLLKPNKGEYIKYIYKMKEKKNTQQKANKHLNQNGLYLWEI